VKGGLTHEASVPKTRYINVRRTPATRAPVFQLAENAASKSVQCGFESHSGHHSGHHVMSQDIEDTVRVGTAGHHRPRPGSPPWAPSPAFDAALYDLTGPLRPEERLVSLGPSGARMSAASATLSVCTVLICGAGPSS
jgi:hypothetical protein